MQQPKRVRALWEFAVILHRGNCVGRRSVVLYESALATLSLIKFFGLSFLFASILFAFHPLYSIAFNRKLALLININVPFVNVHQTRGFLSTMLIQMCLGFYGITGNMAYDLFLAIIVSNYQGIVSIWELQLQDLVEVNRRSNNFKNRIYRRAFLRNVYIQLLDTTK